jgi:hypothetical protein
VDGVVERRFVCVGCTCPGTTYGVFASPMASLQALMGWGASN